MKVKASGNGRFLELESNDGPAEGSSLFLFSPAGKARAMASASERDRKP